MEDFELADEDGLQALGLSVFHSLDSMGDAIAGCMDHMDEQNISELSRAFMLWAVPTHLFAHQLNYRMESGEQYFQELPALVYALPPFNQNMLDVLENNLLINEMAVQWMGLRESCEKLLRQIGIPD